MIAMFAFPRHFIFYLAVAIYSHHLLPSQDNGEVESLLNEDEEIDEEDFEAHPVLGAAVALEVPVASESARTILSSLVFAAVSRRVGYPTSISYSGKGASTRVSVQNLVEKSRQIRALWRPSR